MVGGDLGGGDDGRARGSGNQHSRGAGDSMAAPMRRDNVHFLGGVFMIVAAVCILAGAVAFVFLLNEASWHH